MSVAGVGIDSTRPTVRAGARVVAMLVRPHWVPFTISVFGAAVFAGCTVLAAAAFGWVTDEVVIASLDTGRVEPATSVWAGAVVVLSIAVLRAAGVVSRRYYAGMTSERAERWTRQGLARQYLEQPMSWLRRVPTGRLVAHVDADARVLVEALHPLPFSFGVIFLGIFAGISLWIIDPWITLIALVVFPTMVLASMVYSRVVEVPMSAMQSQVAEVAGLAHESFEGALIVKTLGRRDVEVERFDRAADQLRLRRRKVGFIRAGMDSVLNALPLLSTLVVVIVGAFRIRDGAMTPGDIVEVAALFSALAIPMHVMGFLLESLIPSVVAWNRIRPVVEAPIAELPARSPELAHGALGIDVRELDYAWPDRPDELVLRGIDLSIEPGEVVVIVGPTGAGKSTLCAALAGVLDEVSDAVQVGGVSLASMHPADRTERIAYVFQEAFLFAESIRNNIDLDGNRSDDEVRRAAEAAVIADWIESQPEGFGTGVGERGVTVSGGQRQRIALARALVRRAGVVVLDDATSAVDAIVEEQILRALRSAANATMVIVANRLATIERADRVVHLVDGGIAAVGTHNELLSNPAYRDLVMAYAEASDV